MWRMCCKKEIAKLWRRFEGMNIVRYTGSCPKCGHFIGLTQASEEEVKALFREFNKKNNLFTLALFSGVDKKKESVIL